MLSHNNNLGHAHMTCFAPMKEHDAIEILNMIEQFNLAYVFLESSVRNHGLHSAWLQIESHEVDTTEILGPFSV